MNRAGGQHESVVAVDPPAAPREHFIPLRPAELVQKLADDPAVTIFEREQFRQFCQLIEATIHHEYRTRLEELKAAYAPFDPDGEPLLGTAAESVPYGAGRCSSGSTSCSCGPTTAG